MLGRGEEEGGPYMSDMSVMISLSPNRMHVLRTSTHCFTSTYYVLRNLYTHTLARFGSHCTISWWSQSAEKSTSTPRTARKPCSGFAPTFPPRWWTSCPCWWICSGPWKRSASS